MVDDDHVHAELRGGLDLGHRRDAAVRGDQKARPALRQLPHRIDVQAITLDQPIRNVVVDARRRSCTGRELGERTEDRDEHRRAGDSVDVVVTVDADRLSRFERARDPRDGCLDPLQRERIGKVLQPRLKEPRRLLRLPQAARPQRPAHGRQQAQLRCQTAALLRSGGARRLPR